MVAWFLYNTAWHILWISCAQGNTSLPVETVVSFLSMCCVVPASVAVAVMVTKITLVRVNMLERIKHFRFDEAKCHNEHDRTAVQNNIVAFMKHHGHVEDDASDVDTIQDFEAMIQSDVPKLFDASLGRVGFPYHFAVCISLPYGLQCVDYACGYMHDGVPARTVCLYVARTVAFVFAVIPMSFAISFTVAERLAGECRIGHIPNVCIISTVLAMFTGGMHEILKICNIWAAEGRHADVAIFSASLVLLCLATLLFYKPRAYEKHHRRLKAK
jgi:hypothetical protein